MPTNHTPNFNLSQWERTDKVLMDDFNTDNAKIDAALHAVDVRVDGKADASALSSLSATVTSQGSTLSSHAWSLARMGNCQIYSTSYTGAGGLSRTLSFPGYPVFVWVQTAEYPAAISFTRDATCGWSSGSGSHMKVDWTSRSVTWSIPGDQKIPMDISGYKYCVMALLDMSK